MCASPITGNNPKAKRLEFRCPDSSGNPYLAFAAMMMAGLDGIKNKIEPHEPVDKDLYELPPEEAKSIPQAPTSLSPRSSTVSRRTTTTSPPVGVHRGPHRDLDPPPSATTRSCRCRSVRTRTSSRSTTTADWGIPPGTRGGPDPKGRGRCLFHRGMCLFGCRMLLGHGMF